LLRTRAHPRPIPTPTIHSHPTASNALMSSPSGCKLIEGFVRWSSAAPATALRETEGNRAVLSSGRAIHLLASGSVACPAHLQLLHQAPIWRSLRPLQQPAVTNTTSWSWLPGRASPIDSVQFFRKLWTTHEIQLTQTQNSVTHQHQINLRKKAREQ
jgi:hypothetical protein